MTNPNADAPIGVFDSGVGGISVLRAIRQALPAENLIYAADSGHAPYGDRDAAFIGSRSESMVQFLLAQGAKAIVIACNTATVVAVRDIRSWCPVPVVAIEPAVKPAALQTRSGVVGVLATRQTIASSTLSRLCEAHAERARFLLQPCPGLVESVEQGDLTSDAMRALVRGYVMPLLDAGADTLVLGCTHYPFLLPLVRDVAGPDVLIIDPAAAVARELTRRLDASGLARVSKPASSTTFFSSSAPDLAQSVMSALWGERVSVQPIPHHTHLEQ